MVLLLAALILKLALFQVDSVDTIRIDTLWDYSRPAETEAVFRSLLRESMLASNLDYRAELMTQIARTLGLQQRFDAAHALLDSVEHMLPHLPASVRVHYLLERGRVLNSSDQQERASPLFTEAWELAGNAKLDWLAVDAAHMLAIAGPVEDRAGWNQKAVQLAQGSTDPRARRWLGSLYNNMGWDLYDQKKYDSALVMFDRALAARLEHKKPREIQIARWCVGKTYRMMGKVDTALAIQKALVQEMESASDGRDGYVYEEFAECLLAMNRGEDAVPYFAKAYFLLAEDAWLTRDEPERLARLKALGKVK